MAAVVKQRQLPPGYPTGGQAKPPPGYPTGGQAKEEEAPQVVGDNNEKAELNGEDDGETDRGISAGFIISRRKPRLPERGYSGPAIYDPSRYGQSPPPTHGHSPYCTHGQCNHDYQIFVHDEEDGGYGHRDQYYRQQAPPPPRRRPFYRQ